MIGRRRTAPILHDIQTLYNVGTIGDLTDGQLLERFATDPSEVAELAFSALVERHEALVWRVCLAIVHSEHDAEDAFQATFLVMVRKARSLWVRDSLGPWLYQVAYRTASDLRKTNIRRRKHEQRRGAQDAARVSDTFPVTDADRDSAIHDELNRLPEKYRAPLVLCDLEGRTHHEAARFLGWPVGTVKSRQSQARTLLRDRLVRRGLGLAAGGAAIECLSTKALAAVPRGLSQRTLNLAMQQSGQLVAKVAASAKVLALTQRVLRALLWSETKAGALVGLVLNLDREAARKFVREVAERLQQIKYADQTYFGLSELAVAHARLGDTDAAKRTAKSIGEGPTRGKEDMTDGQPYALLCIAIEQRNAGDISGARDTLAEAYQSVRDHPKMRGRDGRYRQIVYGQIDSGDIGGALRSADAMTGERSQILALIARAQAARGAYTTARTTFAQALREAGLSNEKNATPKGVGKKPLPFDEKMSLPERANLAEIQSMAGNVVGALQTIRSMDEENQERWALERVVSARATAGDVAEALRLCLEASKSPEERKAALQGFGEGLETRLSQKFLDPGAR